ncbi:MAG: ribosome maturation factor RimM [Candidatus Tectimicrobiota bacterium]|nr:MAG: ribosome maturation factor RimM [Candidatus Tectomicrobia bacterium]
MPHRKAPETLIAIGRLTKPHGLRGELVFLPYVADLALVPELRERTVVLRRGEEPPQGRRVAGWRRFGRRALIRLEACEDRTQAEGFRNYEVLVPRAWFPPLAEGEYYWFEIEGLAVYAPGGKYMGKVVEIIATGSNDVYVVRRGRREVLVPALKQVVRRVDLARGEMHLAVREEDLT